MIETRPRSPMPACCSLRAIIDRSRRIVETFQPESGAESRRLVTRSCALRACNGLEALAGAAGRDSCKLPPPRAGMRLIVSLQAELAGTGVVVGGRPSGHRYLRFAFADRQVIGTGHAQQPRSRIRTVPTSQTLELSNSPNCKRKNASARVARAPFVDAALEALDNARMNDAGATVSGEHEPRPGFVWSNEREPHAQRRREMLHKYPQIKALYGPCSRTKYVCAALVATQLATAYLLRSAPWLVIVLVAYSFGGVLNQALLLAIHELSHNSVSISLGRTDCLRHSSTCRWACPWRRPFATITCCTMCIRASKGRTPIYRPSSKVAG